MERGGHRGKGSEGMGVGRDAMRHLFSFMLGWSLRALPGLHERNSEVG